MTDKVKQMAPVIWEEIQKANNILLHCHPNPDADSIGSVLAMMHFLKSLGKNVTAIIGDSEKPTNLDFLPGFDQIEPKNYFQIDNSKFDLFLILDSSSLDQISKKSEMIFPQKLRTVVVDHHSSNREFGQVNLVDTSYGSLAEMIYDLFKLWHVQISPQMAICLFLGIYTDTGFRYPRTTSDTFAAASELAKIYPDFPEAIFKLENSEEPERIKFIGLALSSVETYFNNNVAIAAVSFDQMEKLGIKARHTEKTDIPNYLKSVKGWNIGIKMNEVEVGKVSVSFRTRDASRWDVAKIATATGSGGGHPAAAGATIKKPLAEAKTFLLETIEKVYPELGTP
ncbi:MAG: Phosphoesterase RecJ domain protein [Microgenomates group bacterium GW2011_GWA1_48_10]|uniref:DDH domain-containing protein n=1 Tax=Candidatus Gottesmanbacteria bacterium RIFCSPHIGHO2_01_FULL_47_48 TaxID=1798381 RepID=A0A1F6A5P2_9BACT|nr:MAG: Phosphoesterase RecJ domain protein [Microgenomates group bacterium GW2011_GWA1_48_10]OGG19804.1 MAG: hypothetical protein A2721_01370 [Candidatus Gottesmanbacteria bacterium RIFCSPHIGHO2_01_FULL_47_48]